MDTESFAMGCFYWSPFVPSSHAFFAASCTLLTVSLYLPSVLESTNSPALSIAEPTVSAFCASKSLALSRNPMFRPFSSSSRVGASRPVSDSPPWLQFAGGRGVDAPTRFRHRYSDARGICGGQQPLDRFAPRVRRQPEGAPVDRHQKSAVDVHVRLNGVLGIHVNVGPHLVVGTDRHQRHVERSVVGTDLREALGVAGVAAEVRSMRRPDDRPRRPQRRVAV